MALIHLNPMVFQSFTLVTHYKNILVLGKKDMPKFVFYIPVNINKRWFYRCMKL